MDKQLNFVRSQPTRALKNMIKALSSLSVLNTLEDDQRLCAAEIELKRRLGNKYKHGEYYAKY